MLMNTKLWRISIRLGGKLKQMILNRGAMFVQWRPCPRMSLRTVMCLASPSSTAEQLRQQLDNLHKEADSTRAKANNARLRLMRLSEVAEKLRKQAAVNVRTGNENDARDLLFQKKVVMQAMEKLKNRIELFDDLSGKLNEAISMKEGLLIGNMALDLEVSDTESPTPIRIVSPKEGIPNNSNDNKIFDVHHIKSGEDEESQVSTESQTDIHVENQGNDEEVTFSGNTWNNIDNVQGPKGNSPYEDFMKNLDQDLYKMEKELESFLRYSALLLDNEEKPEYSKVQHVMEILEGIRLTRERISTTMQTTSL